MTIVYCLLLIFLTGWEYLSVVEGGKDCKMTQTGVEYFGFINVTVTGRICQNWNSQYPQKHTVKHILQSTRNYCRNLDKGNFKGPWCYTIDQNKRWEYCNIPLCPITNDDCYEENKGFLYTGKINKTETGYPCRRWDSEEAYEILSGLANYCRSPDGATFPWCLSTAPGKRWEKCDIPICGQPRQPFTTPAMSTTRAPIPRTTLPTTTVQGKTTTRNISPTTSATTKRTEPSGKGRPQTQDELQSNEDNRASITADLVIAIITLVGVITAVLVAFYILYILYQTYGLRTPTNQRSNAFPDMQPIVLNPSL